MSHGTSETVDCPACGQSFDPSAAGGWCTNSACGEWQYEGDAPATGDAAGGSAGASAGGGSPAAVADGGEAAPESADDAEDATADASDDADGDVSNAETVKDADGGAATAETVRDDGDAATAETVKDVGGDDAVDDADDDGVGGDDERDDTLRCPDCDAVVEAEDNFCRSCGTEVSHLRPGGELSNCPDCGTDVDPEDNFCRNCGEDLDAHRPDAPADAGDGADGAETGDDDAAADAGAGEGPAPDEPSLVLVVRNREIQVTDGDTVGREVRSVIMDTGGDEEDAVRVHREHVRFEREDGEFHLVDLGQNPTVVNGERLEQGDRVPVTPGDRIELSNVAKIRVEAA